MPNFIQHAKFYLFAEFKNNSQQRFLPCALIVKLFFATFIPNKKPLYRIPNISRQTRTRGQPSSVFPLIIRVSILSTSFFLTPKVVRQATGECLETKVLKTREVQEFIGHQHARVKLLDNSAVSRGHINFDDLTRDISCGTDLSRTLYTYDVGYRGECGVPLPHHQDFLTTCLKAKFFQ